MESIDRIENLLELIDFLMINFEAHIHVLETVPHNTKLPSKLLLKEVVYTFIEDFDPAFYRTHYTNKMVGESTTPIISLWDSEVFVATKQMEGMPFQYEKRGGYRLTV